MHIHNVFSIIVLLLISNRGAHSFTTNIQYTPKPFSICANDSALAACRAGSRCFCSHCGCSPQSPASTGLTSLHHLGWLIVGGLSLQIGHYRITSTGYHVGNPYKDASPYLSSSWVRPARSSWSRSAAGIPAVRRVATCRFRLLALRADAEKAPIGVTGGPFLRLSWCFDTAESLHRWGAWCFEPV